jgi:hypothetical protein
LGMKRITMREVSVLYFVNYLMYLNFTTGSWWSRNG